MESVVLLTAGGSGEVGEELHTSQCVSVAQDVASRLVKACGEGERGGPDEPNHDTNQLYHSFQLVLPEGLTCNSPGL